MLQLEWSNIKNQNNFQDVICICHVIMFLRCIYPPKNTNIMLDKTGCDASVGLSLVIDALPCP